MRILQRDYLPAELEPLLRVGGFDGCIAVQACQSVEDTAFLLELARRHAFIKGVVGWVDLCSDRPRRTAREVRTGSGLVGVRHIVHDEPDDDFMLRGGLQAASAGCASSI
jgi:L-fuconolactonase